MKTHTTLAACAAAAALAWLAWLAYDATLVAATLGLQDSLGEGAVALLGLWAGGSLLGLSAVLALRGPRGLRRRAASGGD